MRRPFRYFRGEFLQSVYLKRLAVCPNLASADLTDELAYQSDFQWDVVSPSGKVSAVIRDEDIRGIGKIAGVFQELLYGEDNLGSIYFSPGFVVSGKQRSERGLFDMADGVFRFVRTAADNYPDDIVNESSSGMRMSLVPDELVPLGYVRADRPLFLADGTVIPGSIFPAPPDDGTPYVPYYGDRFLHLEELFELPEMPDDTMFKELIDCMQRIRYNGPTLEGLLSATQIIGRGAICGLQIVPRGKYASLVYTIDQSQHVDNLTRRLNLWLRMCSEKFKYLQPIFITEG